MHALACQDETHKHGTFFDELPIGGGCFSLIDLETNMVLNSGIVRIPTRSITLLHSTMAEGETGLTAMATLVLNVIDGIITTTQNESVAISTDSQALYIIVKNLVSTQATISEVLRSKSNFLSESFLHATWNGKLINITLIWMWDHNEHDQPYNSDKFQNIITKENFSTDLGASLACALVPHNPPHLESILDDYGSCADFRANTSTPGLGLPLSFSLQGPNCHHATRETFERIQSARNLGLSKGGNAKCSTLPRLILAGQIDVPASHKLRELV